MSLSLIPTNDLSFALQGSLNLTGAEISAFDPGSDRLFVTSNAGLQVVNLANPAAPSLVATLDFTTLGFATTDVTSVAVKGGIVAVALPNADKALAGKVVFLNAATSAVLGSVDVGALPDMLTFTPDGTKVLAANEGEVVSDANFGGAGSVSIINIAGGIAAATVQTAGFTSFNGQEAALRAAGVRIWAGKTVSEDVEPEYIAISADGTKAMVTLQEANAVGLLDIATANFTAIVPLGTKAFSALMADFSDRDGPSAGTLMQLETGNPVRGLYMPDAIDSFQAGGQTFYVIANEGDDRDDFLNTDETIRVGNASYDLDNATFPNEAALKNNAELGRLTVSNAPGLRGDTDNDGDIDQILAYGGRSFSILNAAGNIVFDSGDAIERIIAQQFPALFDDTRSDNKGPEPEGIEIASIGGRTFAFVGLERSHMTLAFDITDPAHVTYTGAAQRTGDLNPEGQLFISAADSPTGQALLVTSNEVSNNISVFGITEVPAFTLQLLHYYGESGMLGTTTAARMGALIDKFDDAYANTLVLAEGDSFIPGPWLVGGADPSLNAVAGIGTTALGRPDIAIMNAFGTDASALGNHEFDLGSPVFSGALAAAGSGASAWVGAQFPFLTANLDFSADSSLRGLADATLGGTGTNAFAGQEVSAIKAKIAPYAISTQGGEKIGLIGITTFDLLTKTSPNGTVPKDDANAATSDLQEVAVYVQNAVNALRMAGVNKIVMLDQLDTIERNKALAPLINGVDVMVAGGGHERMGDATDTAVGFNGHSADFVADGYPILTAGNDGKATLIVTTDTEYTYLGRLVLDFNAAGEIITSNLDPAINGAYAATQASLQAAYGTSQTADQIVAGSTIGAKVDAITDAIQSVIAAKDGTVWGYTSVYLEGDRAFGRAQEVNLGNLTADANLYKASVALGGGIVGSLKNGGGIRASIGSIDEDGGKIAPIANAIAGKPDGAISTLDIENALRFDNKLMVFDTNAAGLKAILEFAAGLAPGNGGYMQLGGIRVSFDPDNAAGSKVLNVAMTDIRGNIIARIIEDGVVSSDAPATISMIALNFNAQGGDGYPIKANASNFRYLLNNGTLSAAVDEALDFTAAANVPANALGEQKALQDYLRAFHRTPGSAYGEADTAAALDERIENLNARASDVVFEGVARNGAGTDDRIVGTLGDDTLAGNGGADTLLGGLGDDHLTGGDGNDQLAGGNGADTMLGGSGNDVLTGGAGNDAGQGGIGDDRLTGDAGNDILAGEDGRDTLLGGAGADSLFGGGGNDSILGDAGNDSLAGEDGIDTLRGGDGNDSVAGGAGDDRAFGGAGNDSLLGGAGIDLLDGEAGADTLAGGAGRDLLTGGSGADLFVFLSLADSAPTAFDRIVDFSLGEGDRIDLSGIDANAGIDGDQALNFVGAGPFSGGGVGSVRVRQVSGDTRVEVDAGDGGAAEFVTRLDGLHALAATDFVL
jgi:2',3'-cyclic-nucleotide 2'-phosphodiesterase (5'-nucleotidase family)